MPNSKSRWTLTRTSHRIFSNRFQISNQLSVETVAKDFKAIITSKAWISTLSVTCPRSKPLSSVLTQVGLMSFSKLHRLILIFLLNLSHLLTKCLRVTSIPHSYLKWMSSRYLCRCKLKLQRLTKELTCIFLNTKDKSSNKKLVTPQWINPRKVIN